MPASPAARRPMRPSIWRPTRAFMPATAPSAPTAAWATLQEYHVERYFREMVATQLAPVSREMILNFLSERELGLPKSY